LAGGAFYIAGLGLMRRLGSGCADRIGTWPDDCGGLPQARSKSGQAL